MINTEDISRAHINKIFICENHLITYSLRKLIVIRNFNNKEDLNSFITYTISLKLRIQNYEEKIWLYVINIFAHDIILR